MFLVIRLLENSVTKNAAKKKTINAYRVLENQIISKNISDLF